MRSVETVTINRLRLKWEENPSCSIASNALSTNWLRGAGIAIIASLVMGLRQEENSTAARTVPVRRGRRVFKTVINVKRSQQGRVCLVGGIRNG